MIARLALERHLASWEEHGFGLWATQVRNSGDVIGWVGAWRQDVAPALAGEVEVGWTLRRPWSGHGLATEGARAAASAAFAELGVDRVISLITAANERSIAVAERLDMTLTATTPHGRFAEVELCVYAVETSAFGASPQRRSSR